MSGTGDDDTLSSPPGFRELRPSPDEGLVRRLALDGVMAAVLGRVAPPPRVGRYVLERRADSGGMGVVFQGRDPERGVAVAVKVVAREGHPERARFRRETTTLAELEHPRIVRYLDAGETDDGGSYLVMEWLEGCDLAARLREGVLDVAQALDVGVAAAEGLAGAHAAGVVHRDVKPANLFLVDRSFGDVRVIDFGIARSARADTRLTTTGGMLGTPAYMAPEQVRGQHDERTDVYGLGATLFECLTGRVPFLAPDPSALLVAIATEPAPSVSALAPHVPPSFDALVTRMLAKDPGDRPESMTAVIAELAVVGALLRGPPASRGISLAERSTASEAPPRHVARSPGTLVVGQREIRARLRGAFEESLEEGTAVSLLITGALGSGRTTLLEELGAWLAADHAEVTLLRGRARPDESGTPFALLQQIVASTSVAPTATAPLVDLMRRLGGTGDLAAPAHRDPHVLGDALKLAWHGLCETLAARGPVAVLVDDADDADLASLRLLEHATRSLRRHPTYVVLTLGPESTGTWHGPEARVVEVTPLGARSAEALALDFAHDLGADALRAVLARAGGNPGRLRELVAAARQGAEAHLVTAHTGDAIARLDADSRRVLRAASFTGLSFWSGLVAKILAVEPGALGERLSALTRQGFITVCPNSRVAGEREYRFANELVRDAAYGLCTEEDRRLGHRATAAWLGERGFGSAILARHHREAGQRDQAGKHFLVATRAALAGDDAELVDRLALEGMMDATGEVRGALLQLRAESAFWRDDLARARELADAAADELTAGTEVWLRARSLAVTAAGQAGDNAAVEQIVEQIEGIHTPSQDAEERVVALCRAITQLDIARPQSAGQLRARVLASAAGRTLGAVGRAWLHRATVAGASDREFDRAIDHLVEAHEAHVASGDARAAAQVQMFLATYWIWTGAWSRAEASIEEVERTARRLGAAFLTTWATYGRGKLLVEIAPFDEAREVLARVAEETRSPRIAAGALVYASVAATRAGFFGEATAFAEGALLRHDAPSLRLGATAALVHALAAQGDAAGATHHADALEKALGAGEHLIDFDALRRLSIAEARAAAGDEDRARIAFGQATERLLARAATISDPLRRAEFLKGPHLHASTLARLAPTPR